MKLYQSLPERLRNLTADDLLKLNPTDKFNLVGFLKEERWEQLWEFAECLESKGLSA